MSRFYQDFLTSCARSFIKTKVGQTIFTNLIYENHYFVLRRLGNLTDIRKVKRSEDAKSLKNVDPGSLPPSIENFEDLYWLFTCNYGNRGTIQMDFDEASYLFRAVRQFQPRQIVEIGRWLGGSTVLISTAKSRDAVFTSLDIKMFDDKKLPFVREHAEDSNVQQFLNRIGDTNTHMLVADSRKYVPDSKIDFLFLDGDHSYEGIKADYDHWVQFLNPGAHLLFHDAADTRPLTPHSPGIAKLMLELAKDTRLKHVKNIGSLSHFQYQ